MYNYKMLFDSLGKTTHPLEIKTQLFTDISLVSLISVDSFSQAFLSNRMNFYYTYYSDLHIVLLKLAGER